MDATTIQALQIIDHRCAEMRFPASEALKGRLAARYVARRAEVEALYAMPGVKYEEPGVYFRPTA